MIGGHLERHPAPGGAACLPGKDAASGKSPILSRCAAFRGEGRASAIPSMLRCGIDGSSKLAEIRA
jgi:hypothetical protein